MSATSGRKPNYYLIVFGDDPNKPAIEGGIYPHDKGYIGGAGVSLGDILLPYQNLTINGIGVVTEVKTGEQHEFIQYQYLPLSQSLHWNTFNDLRKSIPELNGPLAWRGNWLQKINVSSFRVAIAGRRIDWP